MTEPKPKEKIPGKVADNRVAGISSQPDSLANEEAMAFSAQTLEEQSNKNHHERREWFQDHLVRAAIAIFWIGTLFLTSTAIIWFYHLLSPVSLHFLSEDQLSTIQTMLFSGILSASITGVAKKYL